MTPNSAETRKGQPTTKRFQFFVKQTFDCTYVVEADTPEQAWERLTDDDSLAECVHQIPEDITSTFEDSSPEQVYPVPFDRKEA